MRQLFVVALCIVGFCVGAVQAAEKLDQKDITILSQEFQNLQLQQQIMQQTAEKNQKRMQEIALILKPYLEDTKGIKPPAKAKKK